MPWATASTAVFRLPNKREFFLSSGHRIIDTKVVLYRIVLQGRKILFVIHSEGKNRIKLYFYILIKFTSFW